MPLRLRVDIQVNNELDFFFLCVDIKTLRSSSFENAEFHFSTFSISSSSSNYSYILFSFFISMGEKFAGTPRENKNCNELKELL